MKLEKLKTLLPLSSLKSHIHQSIANILLSDLLFPLSLVTFLCSISMTLKSMTLCCDCIHFILSECHFHPWKRWHNSPRYFSPLLNCEEKDRLCVCRGGEGGEEGVQNPQGRAPENPREQKRIHIWQSFCLPWQLSVWRGAYNNELD